MRIPSIPFSAIDYEINPKAFINSHNFSTFEDLIEEIRRVDNDDEVFSSMLKEPIFLNNFNPSEFYVAKILDFFDYIISQGPLQAKRCGDGFWLRTHKEFKRASANYQHIPADFLHYCFRHRKIISLIRNISEFPRNCIRSMRSKL